MSTTLVLVAERDRERLLALLTALTRVDEPDFGVVVVDDGATSEVRGLLAALEGDVEVLTAPRREGFGPACDRALATVADGVVVLLDAHPRPVDGWLAPLLAALEEPGVVGARPRAITPAGHLEHAAWWPVLAVRAADLDAVGGFAGTAQPGRAEKQTLLEALEARGEVREVAASQVLV